MYVCGAFNVGFIRNLFYSAIKRHMFGTSNQKLEQYMQCQSICYLVKKSFCVFFYVSNQFNLTDMNEGNFRVDLSFCFSI